VKYIVDTISSLNYWRYVLFSKSGIKTVLSIFGGLTLFIESLDFFNIYARDQYSKYAFFLVIAISIGLAIYLRRPTRSIEITFSEYDFCVEVRIGDIFDTSGAVMLSTNTDFQSDVAGGKIATDSLQGQFTSKYYFGNQNTLIKDINKGLKGIDGPPYPIGTTIPVRTHGKTFYFVAMAELNK